MILRVLITRRNFFSLLHSYEMTDKIKPIVINISQYVNQTTMLYTFNLHIDVCQIFHFMKSQCTLLNLILII